MRLLAIVAIVVLTGCATSVSHSPASIAGVDLLDASRDRHIPINLYFPTHHICTRRSPCPVAFISQGYGLLHTDYSFIANALTKIGYLVVAIQHDLPSDPAISKTGDLFATRTPMWKRGAENIRFVRDTLSHSYPRFSWPSLVLIGHSNGGDLSALALQESPTLASTLITLDNRRYPLPRTSSIKLLSIRGSDYSADSGVLPATQEVGTRTCITTIAGARHNDLNDYGPADLKSKINAIILTFLRSGKCGS